MALPRCSGEVNVVSEPFVNFLNNGKTMVKLRVLAKTRKKVNNEWTDGDPSFFNIVVWDPFASNLVESQVAKGDTVFFSGTLSEQKWEKDGEERTSVQISVGGTDDSVGISARWPRKAGGGKPAPKKLEQVFAEEAEQQSEWQEGNPPF